MTEKIWLVILEDHHSDVEVQAYSRKRLAFQRFEEIVEMYNELYGKAHLEGEADECPEEWEANAILSSEGDAVRVQAVYICA